MLVAHEPARLVGADRQDGELERPVALARAAEIAGRRRSRNRRRNRCCPPGASITNDAHSDMLRSDRLRADQCRVGTSVTATPAPSSTRSSQSKPSAAIAAIVIAHDGVVAERRDDARAMRGGEPRQRRDIEMIVVAVRHQHDVDRRQVGKRDAGIVDPLRPDEAERRRALRPDRIEQDIEARGLDQKAGVADIGDAPSRAFDARRRTVGIRRRRPGRPFRPGAAQPALQEPAQQIAPAPGGAAARSKKRSPSK